MTTKNTTDIIQSFLSRKDPLTELNKIRNVMDVMRDDAYLAATGELDLSLGELHSLLDTSTHNLDEVIEFMTAMQAEVIADMQAYDVSIEFMKVH
jgi:hypothetical protein